MILRHCRRRLGTCAIIWVLGLLALDAEAQTWVGNRAGPSLTEIVTVDQTGETNWLWGNEDVAGDGLGTFDAAEQAIDGRAVYLTTGNSRLWFRLTLSSTVAPDGNLVAYLFIDSDNDVATGRTAAATEVDPAFTADPTDGGYEAVLSVRGDGTMDALWTYDTGSSAFSAVTLTSEELAEADVYVDPLRIGATDHGYVQASVALARIGVDATCDARFFVRTTNDNPLLGDGDLDVGSAVGCVPVDGNDDGVADVLEPTVECTTDDQCAAGGICWNSRCWLSATCTDNTDCATTETCVDGSCQITSGGNCSDSSDCASLVCDNGQCVACTSSAECGTGLVCGPDGRCIDESTADNQAANGGASGAGGSSSSSAGTATNDQAEAGSGVTLEEGDRIQGGACACRASGSANRKTLGLLSVLGLGLMLGQRRRQARKGQK